MQENNNENNYTNTSLDSLYFKDCFTEVDGNINETINKLTVKCFNSINNTFSMDCDGNLIVNSITTKEVSPQVSGGLTFDMIYPIGSIYMSVNSTNPGTLFGGEWERISKGRTLIGIDEDDTDFNNAEKTGGSKTHTLTIDEMPSHKHSIKYNMRSYYQESNAYFINADVIEGIGKSNENMKTLYHYGQYADFAGGGQAHSIMEPYYTCYIWKRVA